jgi:hypothetical protein
MGRPAGEFVTELVRNLAKEGLALEHRGSGDDYVIRSADDLFAFEPVLTMPEALLAEYLEQLGRDIRDDPNMPLDPLTLTTIHVVEELETDHHEGRNYVRALGFRRGRRGRVELFVEKDVPELPYRPPNPDLEWCADESDRWTR